MCLYVPRQASSSKESTKIILLGGSIWIWHLLIYFLQNLMEKSRDYSLLFWGYTSNVFSHLTHVGLSLRVFSETHGAGTQTSWRKGGKDWRLEIFLLHWDFQERCPCFACAVSVDHNALLKPFTSDWHLKPLAGLKSNQNLVWDLNPQGQDLNLVKTVLGIWIHMAGTQTQPSPRSSNWDHRPGFRT